MPNIPKITIFANCQGAALAYLLKSKIPNLSVSFFPNYQFITEGAQHIHPGLDASIRNSDLVIWQPLRSTWGIYSILDSIYGQMAFISFPYIYIDGLWPFYPDGKKLIGNLLLDAMLDASNECKLEAKKKLIDLLSDPYSLSAAKSQEGFPALLVSDLDTRLYSSLKTLSEKEASTDVHVSLTIQALLSKGIAPMYTQNHPGIEVLLDLADKVVCCMLKAGLSGECLSSDISFKEKDDLSLRHFLYGTTIGWPLIPCVANYYSIDYSDNNQGAIEIYGMLAERYFHGTDLSFSGCDSRGYPIF